MNSKLLKPLIAVVIILLCFYLLSWAWLYSEKQKHEEQTIQSKVGNVSVLDQAIIEKIKEQE